MTDYPTVEIERLMIEGMLAVAFGHERQGRDSQPVAQ